MPQCLIVILHKTDNMSELLDTWQNIGVPGVTMFEGVGGYRANQRLKKGFRSSLSHLFKLDELHSKTLITVIDDDDLIERAIAEVERLIGDFDDPNTGLLFTLPVNQVVGLLNVEKLQTAPPPRPAPVEIEGKRPGDMPVSALRDILSWEPIIVQAKQSLMETVEAVVARPNDVDVACVVNQQQRLVGLLPLNNLVDDLFATLEPAEFLSLTFDKDEVMQYAKQTGVHTAGDAMIPAVWVTDQDKISLAFTKMHDNKLSGIPIVNDRYEVTGYINLQELLAFYIHSQNTSES